MVKYLKNIKIERIGYGGIGITKSDDGKKILIKGGALPGSIVDCVIKKNKKDYLEGHITKVHEYDSKYIDGEIFCPHFFSNIDPNLGDNSSIEKHKIGCGGCKWQMISYPKQIELKQEIVEDCFRKVKEKPSFLPIVASPKEKGYRNKIEFSFGVYMAAREGIESKWNLGFHKQGEFSKIIDVDSCGLISDKANSVFEYIKKLCFESGLSTYDQKFNRGFFRHLVIREGVNTKQLMINLAVYPLDKKDKININNRENLKKTFKEDEFIKENITSFVITYNDGLADIVKGPNISTENIIGDGYIYEKLILDGIGQEKVESTFRISPFSFFQTNTHGAELLFQTAMNNVLEVGEIKGKILDLYCGTGSIGISFLKAGVGNSLIGIEIVEEAIQDANYNAEINGIKDNCKFIASPSEKVLSKNPEIENELTNIGLVIVDPPREGLHKNVVERISQLKEDNNFKLLYISCNPSTMARDIELFIEKGFKVKSLQAVDMFPHTHHIETVGVLV
ncbi:MAG TPA: 23S rRNA (uracil(1939)-C(5))-methyltransferase RlmD [Candidatus Absconditabacterales bacterium]|nr:23S rRNA (uracil(1939)-C(5))-methyltransferase RlmD [Candidatus Absconditabacterales bacterium]HPK28059.1 23S rRNA (uracil(1939)-C(5))-methyltransferase RlmD [Candidatus Absconditabacterales bacterium]